MTELTELPPTETDPGPTSSPLPESLADFLYPEPAPRSTWGIVKWWEKRRLPYNLIVGSAGLFTTFWFGFLSILPGPGAGENLFVPLEAILVVGVMANLCYLLGPLLESLSLRIFGRGLLPIGPALYRMGLTFSVGLVLFPAFALTIVWVIATVLEVLPF